ncbi:MAG: undecaprenyl/decaprenyl-phosphate alpha-N-acetylglucosaminyl 1-phosphate transferase [Bacteroidetes bacterium]|nr:undecaprenyl/decaprenyl-phosphate alpha-N-acetylglucosaminyl 1-phosphate transferase [Bacteroidota bacterium]
MNHFLLFVSSLLLSILFIILFKKIGKKYNFCDETGEDRLKIHQQPIPYLGGLSIFLTSSIILLVVGFWNNFFLSQIFGFILSGGIIIILGLWDDFKLKKGKPRLFLKLFSQFLSALIIFLVLTSIGLNFNLGLMPFFIFLLFAFYLIGAMNAMNMEDGVDGLAGSLALISFIGFIILSIILGNSLILIIGLIFSGAILGFLLYNWHPASIFMGDNGSHFLGFSLVVLAIIFTGHPFYNFKWFITPLFIIGLPLIEVIWAIIRRIAKGKSPFLGDRSHLYDKLDQKGLTIPQTVLICCSIQVILVISGILIIL